MLAKMIASLLLAMVLTTSLLAQASAAPCDPQDPNLILDFLDLAPVLGQVVCKAGPKVNTTDALLKLNRPISKLTPAQLERLPGLIRILLVVPPSSVQPVLKLKPEQLEKLVPFVNKVPADKIAGLFQLLSDKPSRTLSNTLMLLRLIDKEQLELLAPAFSNLTPQQAEILRKALRILPDHAFDFLVFVTRKLAPATDHFLAPKLTAILPTVSISDSKYEVPDVQPPNTKDIADKFYADAAAKAAKAKNCTEDQATEASLDVVSAITTDIGNLACKFGTPLLKKVLVEVLSITAAQSPETLANLPTLTNNLANLPPASLNVFFKIPQETLRRLIPILATLPQDKLTEQLQILVKEDPETIDKLIFFVNNVPFKNIVALTPFFSQINENQVRNLAKLMANLSAGQIELTMRLLDKFGFAMNPIGELVGVKMEAFDAVTGKEADGTPSAPEGKGKRPAAQAVTIPASVVKKAPSQVTVKVGPPKPWKPKDDSPTVTVRKYSYFRVTEGLSKTTDKDRK